MILIGVDFSKNSTGITVNQNDNYVFFNFSRDYKGNEHKKAFKYHNELNKLPVIAIGSYELLETKKLQYSDNEWNKVLNGKLLAENIINIIEGILTWKDDSFKWDDAFVGFEGFSYGSPGNTLIDIVTMTTILKDTFYRKTGKRIEVFSPKAVKKFATDNGNANKAELFYKFLETDNQFSKFCEKVLEIEKEKIEKGKVPKPLDDMIDSYFVLKMLESMLSSNNNISS